MNTYYKKNSNRNVKIVVTDNVRQYNLKRLQEEVSTFYSLLKLLEWGSQLEKELAKKKQRSHQYYGFNKYRTWI